MASFAFVLVIQECDTATQNPSTLSSRLKVALLETFFLLTFRIL
jgi:hypothetical protein